MSVITRCCPFGCAESEADSTDLIVTLPYGGDGTFAIMCIGCNCYGPLAQTEDEAVVKWNTKESG